MSKSKRFFTLIEIVIVLAIIAVLATLTIPVYFNLIEKSKNTICETNQRVLLGALEMYGIDNPVLPASLSQLREKDIQGSWAKILLEPGSWKIRLAYAISNFDLRQAAYAGESWLQEYLGLVRGPACPSDLIPPPVNTSYGISENFAGKSSAELMNADRYDIVIGDSDTETFIDPVARHTKYSLFGSTKFAIVISAGREIFYFPEETNRGHSSTNRSFTDQSSVDYESADFGSAQIGSWKNRGECVRQFNKVSEECKRTRSRDQCYSEKNYNIQNRCPEKKD